MERCTSDDVQDQQEWQPRSWAMSKGLDVAQNGVPEGQATHCKTAVGSIHFRNKMYASRPSFSTTPRTPLEGTEASQNALDEPTAKNNPSMPVGARPAFLPS